ncbi:bestrophin-4-like isoform X2 [Portunus trituberculatus]|uniref:bestrophin-4-like isoform X2 n=1 Tax=Portunus trituberculatus TaxID=210409 RepID=UPI001E1CB532|nr:bestrophin-4-like isoform X2 [Portunus trituberculatus]
MTVTYTHEVADCKGFGNFWRLLFRWRGSVYKLVWLDLLCYTTIYTVLSVVYRVVLAEDQKRLFEKVSLYCNYFSDYIPVSFVLGFYVSIVIKRWWDQYQTLLWPDSLALFVSTCMHGHDRQGRLMRRTILRYVNLSFVLTLTMITPRAKKRFPTLDHIVEAGFMTTNEKKIFSAMVEKTDHPLYYVPLVWAGTLVSRARKEGRIRDDFAVKTIMDELNNLRIKINGLISYDWISIPLVYTQVVSLAVYTFFVSTIMGRQFLDPKQNYPKNNIDFYFPIFTMLQFFFYMGWLKVAESLVNPFGEDDDDFEVNWLIDRNIQVSYLIVDEMHNEHPELMQDLYWDEVFPQELPYTVAAEQYKRDPPMGSTANLRVPEAEQEFVPTLEEVLEEKMEESEEAEKTDGTPGVRRLDSARSIGSSMSGRKSSLMSILHNKWRRGDLRSSMGSQISVRKSRMRSVSQSGSQVSDASFGSSVIKRNNTNTSFQDSDMHLSHESMIDGNGEGIPVFLSSSPKPNRKKIIPSLATIKSSSSTSSHHSNRVHPQGDADPVVIKVADLQVDSVVDKNIDKGAMSHSRVGSPHSVADSTASAMASIFTIQGSEIHEGDNREEVMERSQSAGSHKEPHLSKSDAEKPTSAEGTQGDAAVEDAKEVMPGEDAPEDENVH